MRDRDWAAVVLAMLLVIGGVGVLDEPSTASTAVLSEGGTVSVTGDELSFNATTVYGRVGEMHGKEGSELPRATVDLRERPASAESYSPTPFEEHMGIEPQAGDTGPAAYAQGQQIVLYTDVVETSAMREQVLAHEMAHVIQFDENVPTRVDRGVSGFGADEDLLELAIIEGAATYAENRYAAEYIEESTEPPTWAERRRNVTELGAFVLAHYHFGYRYADQRVDSVEQLDEVYDDPPQTTEQLIHGYGPDEELPPELPVTVEGLGDDYRVDDRRTKGELFVRIVLEGQLDLDRAADAAAGWGNDELVVFEDGDGEPNYAWVLSWDTPEDAEEFLAAKRDFLDRATGDRRNGRWREDGVAYDVRRTGEETVVVFVGDSDFVAGTSATADHRGVTVTVDGDGARTGAVAAPAASPTPAAPSTVDGARTGPTVDGAAFGPAAGRAWAADVATRSAVRPAG